MHKVRTLITEARKRDDCKSGPNADALQRLEAFIDGFVSLSPSDVAGPEAWYEYVRGYTGPDWMDKLEFSALLSNFGFEPDVAKSIQFTTIEDDQGDGTSQTVSVAPFDLTVALLLPPPLSTTHFGVLCARPSLRTHETLR